MRDWPRGSISAICICHCTISSRGVVFVSWFAISKLTCASTILTRQPNKPYKFLARNKPGWSILQWMLPSFPFLSKALGFLWSTFNVTSYYYSECSLKPFSTWGSSPRALGVLSYQTLLIYEALALFKARPSYNLGRPCSHAGALFNIRSFSLLLKDFPPYIFVKVYSCPWHYNARRGFNVGGWLPLAIARTNFVAVIRPFPYRKVLLPNSW